MPSEMPLRSSRPAACGAAFSLALLALLLVPATATAQPDIELATSATHVVGLDASDPGCTTDAGDDGGNVELSDDRGQTWGAPGACVAWDWTSSPSLDAATGHVVFLDTVDDVVTVVDSSGSVVMTASVGDDATSIAADGSVVYVLGTTTVTRIGSGGATATCSTPSGAVTSSSAIYTTRGALVLDDRSATDGQVWASTDGCSTFRDITPPSGCSSPRIGGPTTLFVTCPDLPAVRELNLAGSAGWSAGATPLGQNVPNRVPFETPAYGLATDGHTLHQLDTLSTADAPATWPTPAPPGTHPPVTAPDPRAADAFSLVNASYRRPLGLGDLSWDPAAGQAAQAHADYLAANGATGPAENDGAPGFTGEQPTDRCAVAGSTADECDELDSQLSTLAGATAQFLGTPTGLLALLGASPVGMGVSSAGSVAVAAVTDPTDQLQSSGPPPSEPIVDLSAAADTRSSAVQLWPPDGATGIPTSWTGTAGDPFIANDTGDRSAFGPALYVGGLLAGTVSLTGPHGKLPLLASGASQPATTVHYDASTPIALLPVGALSAGATYELDLVRDDTGATMSARFTPGSSISGSSGGGGSSGSTSLCHVRLVHYVRAGHRFVRWQATKPCQGKVLVQRLSVHGHWLRIHPPLRLHPAMHVRWRARFLKHTVAHGLLVTKRT
jgi:hypothetical protein